jgi:NTE family protein
VAHGPCRFESCRPHCERDGAYLTAGRDLTWFSRRVRGYRRPMRVGLVLGAGGVVGASWLIGALEALEAETGWRAAEAERIVGTSAGSVIGAIAATGVPAGMIAAYSAGRPLDDTTDHALRDEAVEELRAEPVVERVIGTEYRLHLALPPIGPGSWRLAAESLRHPRRHSTTALMAGWLPRGVISTASIQALVEHFVDGDWPAHPSYWAVAADYATGRRVAFGREDAPPARVAEAVAASCAIPGFYHPVTIAGRRYVDGGICSASNLDLLRDDGLDLVLCFNPMSSLAQATGGSPSDRLAALMRVGTGRRLGHEARKLREQGTRVVTFQPSAEDLALMGANLMSSARRLEVMASARRSVERDLRRLRTQPDLLPRRRGPASAGRRRAATTRRAA